MSTATAAPNVTLVSASRSSTAVSWVSRFVIFAATCIVVGILWDISWHRTVGRDTFWTPAHLAIYLGGLLGGTTAGWLVLRTTVFGTAAEKAGAVRLWGMYGPMGAWVSIWGAVAMLTSAPFDNWWHDAYGLDVKIISPPHSVLAFGMWAVVGGGLLLVLREQNNTPANAPTPARWLFVYGTGVLLAMASVFLTERSFPNHQRTETFYTWSAAAYPLYLLGVARAARFRWASTLMALCYMLIIAAMAWILPLFPGEPKLGPVNNRVTHFVPLPFPLLLVLPALAMDIIRNAIGHGRSWWRDWLIVICCAVALVVVFTAVQWNFSNFMLSSGADNWFFAADRHWGYGERLGSWRQRYWDEVSITWTAGGLYKLFGGALIAALISCRLGLWLGNWMSKVRR